MLAEGEDRDERHVRAFSQSLRKAIEAGASEERLAGLTRAALGSRGVEGVTAGFNAWQEARARLLAADPAAPETAGLGAEVDRLWAAYEAAVDQADGGGDR